MTFVEAHEQTTTPYHHLIERLVALVLIVQSSVFYFSRAKALVPPDTLPSLDRLNRLDRVDLVDDLESDDRDRSDNRSHSISPKSTLSPDIVSIESDDSRRFIFRIVLNSFLADE